MDDKSEQDVNREETKDELSINFMADSMKIYGPKVDGSFTVTFGTGEYEQLNIAKLMAISQATIIKVKVEPENV